MIEFLVFICKFRIHQGLIFPYGVGRDPNNFSVWLLKYLSSIYEKILSCASFINQVYTSLWICFGALYPRHLSCLFSPSAISIQFQLPQVHRGSSYLVASDSQSPVSKSAHKHYLGTCQKCKSLDLTQTYSRDMVRGLWPCPFLEKNDHIFSSKAKVLIVIKGKYRLEVRCFRHGLSPLYLLLQNKNQDIEWRVCLVI